MGLALSSRNNYLTQSEQKDASIIYKYLQEIADQLRQVRSDSSKDLSMSALMAVSYTHLRAHDTS